MLNSGQLDATKGTITLPLYLGHMKGTNKNVWYILTDVDDANVAAELGLNFSAKMTFMAPASRTANLDNQGNLVFDAGTVDFSPVRSVVPGPSGAEFPPKSAHPGAIGDANYSPYVRIVNAADVIYNAPIVAFGADAAQIDFPNGNVDYKKVHDQVVAIDLVKHDGNPPTHQRLQLRAPHLVYHLGRQHSPRCCHRAQHVRPIDGQSSPWR